MLIPLIVFCALLLAMLQLLLVAASRHRCHTVNLIILRTKILSVQNPLAVHRVGQLSIVAFVKPRPLPVLL